MRPPLRRAIARPLSPARSAASSFWVAVRIRVFAVPTGIDSISPISRAVKPNRAASNSARRWSPGSSPSESRSALVDISGSSTDWGAVAHIARSASRIESGSSGSVRLARRWSIARLRVIESSQVATRPRRTS